jgi:predicted RNA-binding protein with PUA-like domain
MQYFLAKTDPETYSIDQFAKDKVTVWDGVKSAQAVMALKAMQPGDTVLIYHSQGEGAIRGLAKVTKNLGIDPKEPRSWLVELKFIRQFTEPYVTLKAIKQTGKFADFALVKQSRLSTMPAPKSFITWLEKQGLNMVY